MIERKYETEFSEGVMTVRMAPPNILLWRLFVVAMALWVLAALVQIIIIVTALAEHSHVREAFASFPISPFPCLLFLLFFTGNIPWRCILDAPKDKVTLNRLRTIPLSMVTGAHVVYGRPLPGKNSRGMRHLNLETKSGRDITIFIAPSTGGEDDAKVEEVALRINQYLSAWRELSSRVP